jgi:outer membrane protein assembly factor BamD (BamD/ComL family)
MANQSPNALLAGVVMVMEDRETKVQKEYRGISRCAPSAACLPQYQGRSIGIVLSRTLLLGLVLLAGCQSLRSDRSLEYDTAKNAVEGYEDQDGNWVRPEGSRAEKKGNRPLLEQAGAWIPGLTDKPADRPKAQETYRQADTLFEQAKDAQGEERRSLFRKAAKKYSAAGKLWRSSYLEQDAMFMEAESRFFAEDYASAEQDYATLIKEYPRTRYQDRIDSRRMEIALYWLQYQQASGQPFFAVNATDKRRPWIDTAGHGKKTLENIRLGNPTGTLSDDVTMRLANRAFEEGKFQDAADHYEDLRMTYPDSPHQFDAHFLGLKAELETYEGPDYSVAPLDRAEKLIQQILRQFPKEAQEQREYLQKSHSEVRYRKAERAWTAAEYRMLREENNAARVYLDQILTEYSDTPFADKARDAVEKIKDRPGVPPQRFQWLANMFPENDPVAPLLQATEGKP